MCSQAVCNTGTNTLVEPPSSTLEIEKAGSSEAFVPNTKLHGITSQKTKILSTADIKQLCPLLFPQQRLSDCRHIQHFDFILCWICDLLCHWFPRTWATSGSKECCRPRSRSCFHRVPWSGSSTAGLAPVVSPLLCDATHTWAGFTICSHGDCHNCYTRSFP